MWNGNRTVWISVICEMRNEIVWKGRRLVVYALWMCLCLCGSYDGSLG